MTYVITFFPTFLILISNILNLKNFRKGDKMKTLYISDLDGTLFNKSKKYQYLLQM